MGSAVLRRRLTASLVALLVLAGGVLAVRTSGPSDRTLTATFARTTGLYAGAQVKVLGVEVGRVASIRVVGTGVEVRMTYRHDVELPRDVTAVIVPPSILGDRFVQLSPVYTQGATLADGARLERSRTAVPVEMDDTYQALETVAKGLGPDGANRDGALSRIVTATARTFDGRGRATQETSRRLAAALQTLAESGGDIGRTIDHLSTLTSTLSGSDADVRRLVGYLTAVSVNLDDKGDDLTTAITDLQTAMADVDTFARENRSRLRTTVSRTRDVSKVIGDRTAELTRLLEIAPVGLSNLADIYIPTNWDPSRPWASSPAGRTGSGLLRADLLQDLDTQLGFTLSGVCRALPSDQQARLGALCGGLTAAGGSLGGLLSQLVEQHSGSPVGAPTGLASLLGGAS